MFCSSLCCSEYILPNGSTRLKGSVREVRFAHSQLASDDLTTDDQVLLMNNERFSVPELLFNPQDVGLDVCGLADTIAASINSCAPALHPFLWANILCVGGNVCFPNFKERLELELRAIAPEFCEVRVSIASSPIKAAFNGGCTFARDNNCAAQSITAKAYKESGRNAWARLGQ